MVTDEHRHADCRGSPVIIRANTYLPQPRWWHRPLRRTSCTLQAAACRTAHPHASAQQHVGYRAGAACSYCSKRLTCNTGRVTGGNRRRGVPRPTGSATNAVKPYAAAVRWRAQAETGVRLYVKSIASKYCGSLTACGICGVPVVKLLKTRAAAKAAEMKMPCIRPHWRLAGSSLQKGVGAEKKMPASVKHCLHRSKSGWRGHCWPNIVWRKLWPS